MFLDSIIYLFLKIASGPNFYNTSARFCKFFNSASVGLFAASFPIYEAKSVYASEVVEDEPTVLIMPKI